MNLSISNSTGVFVNKVIIHSLALLCLLAIPAQAVAQQANTPDIQNFRANLAPDTVFSTEGAATLGHFKPGAALILNYANQPLLFETAPDGEISSVVDQQLAAHLMLGVGLFDRLQLDLQMPLYPINTGNTEGVLEGGGEFSGFVAGNLRARAKGTIWSTDRVGLAASLAAGFPTGSKTTFVADDSVTITPSLIASAHLGSLMLAANLGARLNNGTEVRDLELGPDFEFRLGAQWFVLADALALDFEIFGRRQLAKTTEGGLDANIAPIEALLGGKWFFTRDLSVMAGAGTGIIQGYGSPRFRAIAGLTYAPHADVVEEPVDSDGDGIFDPQDQCPTEPEDKDGFEDEDGCPDLDNDGDGIADADDKCPTEAEDKDGFEDEDGCPEDDNDKDGVKDAEDKCPTEAEDKDGFEDEDGCPDPDNDQDSIADVDDKCPDKAGPATNGGCPEEKPKTRVIVTKKNIEITEKIFFDFDKAVIRPESYGTLDEVAEVLVKYPQLKRIEIAGHSDQTGEKGYNKRLSRDRAEAVKKYLVKKGVKGSRLTTKGYGDTEPLIKEEKSDADSAKNRRVVFEIIEQDPIEETQTITEP